MLIAIIIVLLTISYIAVCISEAKANARKNALKRESYQKAMAELDVLYKNFESQRDKALEDNYEVLLDSVSIVNHIHNEVVVCSNGHKYLFADFHSPHQTVQRTVYNTRTEKIAGTSEVQQWDSLKQRWRTHEVASSSTREIQVPSTESIRIPGVLGCPTCHSSLYVFEDSSLHVYQLCTLIEMPPEQMHLFKKALGECPHCKEIVKWNEMKVQNEKASWEKRASLRKQFDQW